MGRARHLIVLGLAILGPAAATRGAGGWLDLDRYQQSLTAAEFSGALGRLDAPAGALSNCLALTPAAVMVYSTGERTNPPLFTLRFASPGAPRPRPARFFKDFDQLRQLHNPTNAPLRGLRLVLDPGHIGGEWARLEERFFVLNKQDRPVQEAVLNLAVARLLQAELEAAGATVLLTKNDFQPVTTKRPVDFRAEALRDLALAERFAAFPPLEREAAVADAIRKRQELLFYRNAEITARARLVNEVLKPDLTLCLHFNAVEWNERFELVDDNRLVVFVHGHYLPGELADDEQKLRLFAKLLEGSRELERGAAAAIAAALAAKTGLPPVEYGPSGPAARVGENPYVYARNLAANRLYDGPVIFLEPYYQNNRLVYQRLQLGDYPGTREIGGHDFPSIYREYADAVAAGVIGFYAPFTTMP